MTVLLFLTRQQFDQKKKMASHASALRLWDMHQLNSLARMEGTGYSFNCRHPRSGQSLVFDQGNFYLARAEIFRRSQMVEPTRLQA